MPTRPPVFRPAHLPAQNSNRRAFDQLRGSASARGYDRHWQKVRLHALQREPLCRFCAAKGLTVAAEEVDHIETIAARPDLRLVLSNLRPLCKSCHSRRTAGGNADTKPGCDAAGRPTDPEHPWNRG